MLYYTNKLSSNVQQQLTSHQLLQFVVISRGRPELKEKAASDARNVTGGKRDAQYQSNELSFLK